LLIVVIGFLVLAVGWQTAVGAVGPGGGITSPNMGTIGTLDILPGDDQSVVWSLDIETGIWTQYPAPAPINAGGAISHLVNDCDYAFAGGNTPTFFKTGLAFSCGGTTPLADAPGPVGPGGSLVAILPAGGAAPSVYALRGGGTTDFWRYAISQDIWEVLPDIPAPALDGAAVVEVWDPMSLSYTVAALRGGGTHDFWIYNINTAAWQSATPLPSPIGAGGSLAQGGTVFDLYAFTGNGTQEFWRYEWQLNQWPYFNLHGGTWRRVADVPEPIEAGGGLVGIHYGLSEHADKMYALVGGGSNAIYRYSISLDSWSYLADVPPREPTDVTPPTVTCAVDPAELWPPNNRLRGVRATVAVSDPGGSGPDGFRLQSVTSNEPTIYDIVDFEIGTADVEGQLRASRAGSGAGRIYTFTYEGRDLVGNTATCSASVRVAHDMRLR
jgi:hypothetical protein